MPQNVHFFLLLTISIFGLRFWIFASASDDSCLKYFLDWLYWCGFCFRMNHQLSIQFYISLWFSFALKLHRLIAFGLIFRLDCFDKLALTMLRALRYRRAFRWDLFFVFLLKSDCLFEYYWQSVFTFASLRVNHLGWFSIFLTSPLMATSALYLLHFFLFRGLLIISLIILLKEYVCNAHCSSENLSFLRCIVLIAFVFSRQPSCKLLLCLW